jgi:phosphoglycerate kinase
MGVFEIPPFDKGTVGVANAVGEATKKGALTVAGGGDTDKAIEDAKIELTHLSTGGGASLKFLSGEEMPAIKVLGKGV